MYRERQEYLAREEWLAEYKRMEERWQEQERRRAEEVRRRDEMEKSARRKYWEGLPEKNVGRERMLMIKSRRMRDQQYSVSVS